MKFPAMIVLMAASAVAFAEAPKDDATVLDKLVQGNMAEVESGQLAQNKATTDAVKRFGAMMVEQHGAALDKIQSLAKRKSEVVPTAPSEEQREKIKALQATDGPRFDAEYLAEQIRAHEATLGLLNSEIESGRDPEIKALAQELKPTVEAHLRQARELVGEPDAAGTPPSN